MLPFCGYNMADYFAHWLRIGATADADKLPRIFYVNWFRKDADGHFLWPGYGENSRVLEWVFERVSGRGKAVETPIGLIPAAGAIDTDGLEVTDEDMNKLLTVDTDEWRAEVPRIRETLRGLRRQAPRPSCAPRSTSSSVAWAESVRSSGRPVVRSLGPFGRSFGRSAVQSFSRCGRAAPATPAPRGPPAASSYRRRRRARRLRR